MVDENQTEKPEKRVNQSQIRPDCIGTSII